MRDVPLPVVVAGQIRDWIQEGRYKVGQRLPSERLLADQMGVSRQVVRQALADLCRDGVLDCQPRCRPVVIAGPRNDKRTIVKDRRIYLLVFPHVSDFISSQLLKGVQKGMLDPNASLAISTPPGGRSTSWIDSEREQLLGIAADPMACGAIIWYIGGKRNLAALQAVREAGIPMVFVDREAPEGFDADYVGTDNFEAARIAVRHLIRLGHRRIGMLSNQDPVSSVQRRQEGYMAALTDGNIPFENELLTAVDLTGTTFEDATKSAIDRLLGLSEPPTAIFAVNDQIALRMIPILVSMGVRIPEELSLVGFDGWLRWLPGGGNLTSAGQQFERIGHLASDLLHHRMHHGEPAAYRHIILEAPLILNDSTSPPRGQSRIFQRNQSQERVES